MVNTCQKSAFYSSSIVTVKAEYVCKLIKNVNFSFFLVVVGGVDCFLTFLGNKRQKQCHHMDIALLAGIPLYKFVLPDGILSCDSP